jgi:uncharacterized protein YjbJ (UPF0337 family)
MVEAAAHIMIALRHVRQHLPTDRHGTLTAINRWLYVTKQRSRMMDREHVKGAAEKAKGTIKQGAGKISGDKGLEHEGKADKAKGDLHDAAGNVKDAARKTADSLKK